MSLSCCSVSLLAPSRIFKAHMAMVQGTDYVVCSKCQYEYRCPLTWDDWPMSSTGVRDGTTCRLCKNTAVKDAKWRKDHPPTECARSPRTPSPHHDPRLVMYQTPDWSHH